MTKTEKIDKIVESILNNDGVTVEDLALEYLNKDFDYKGMSVWWHNGQEYNEQDLVGMFKDALQDIHEDALNTFYASVMNL